MTNWEFGDFGKYILESFESKTLIFNPRLRIKLPLMISKWM